MKALKYFLIFVSGLAIGAFGGEALMENVHQQRIVDIFTQNEIGRVEYFIESKNHSDEIKYCLLYNSAKHDVYQLKRKVEAAMSGEFDNDLILNKIENFKKLIAEFESLETEDLKYNCENT